MVVMAVLLLVIFETGLADQGLLAGVNNGMEFAITTVMELLTIASIPLALRLFKFKKVDADLQQRHAEALSKWGVMRLAMLELPLLFNILCYELFLNTTFGYMAVITALCLPLVWPSSDRCAAESYLTESEI
jgi:hypothetical protein